MDTSSKRELPFWMLITLLFIGFVFVRFAFTNISFNRDLHFDIKPMTNGRVQMTALPDGNKWITTKDSVEIYIDNY